MDRGTNGLHYYIFIFRKAEYTYTSSQSESPMVVPSRGLLVQGGFPSETVRASTRDHVRELISLQAELASCALRHRPGRAKKSLRSYVSRTAERGHPNVLSQ